MSKFVSYYDNQINETIDTQELHDLITRIRSMDLVQLGKFKDELTVNTQMDPSFSNTKVFRASAKTVIKTIQACRHRGDVLVTRENPTMMQVIEAVMHGMIAGDEFAKRMK